MEKEHNTPELPQDDKWLDEILGTTTPPASGRALKPSVGLVPPDSPSEGHLPHCKSVWQNTKCMVMGTGQARRPLAITRGMQRPLSQGLLELSSSI